MVAGAAMMTTHVMMNWDSLAGDLDKTLRTIELIVSGALIGIGAILTLSGVAPHIGIALLVAGVAGLATVTVASLDWGSILETVKKVLKDLGGAIGVALAEIGLVLLAFGQVPLGIGFIVAGAAAFAAAVALNWDSV